MKVKFKAADRVVIGFSKRELTLISNCLEEACHGLLMDQFIPAHDVLSTMLDNVRGISRAHEEFMGIKTTAV